MKKFTNDERRALLLLAKHFEYSTRDVSHFSQLTEPERAMFKNIRSYNLTVRAMHSILAHTFTGMEG